MTNPEGLTPEEQESLKAKGKRKENIINKIFWEVKDVSLYIKKTHLVYENRLTLRHFIEIPEY